MKAFYSLFACARAKDGTNLVYFILRETRKIAFGDKKILEFCISVAANRIFLLPLHLIKRNMEQNLYTLTSLVTGSVMLTLFFLLIFLHVPQSREWKHFQLSTRLIAAACLVLGANNFCSFLLHIDNEKATEGFLLPIITLAVGSLQALLFTVTSFMLVTSKAFRLLKVTCHLTCIIAISIVCIAAFVTCPPLRQGIMTFGWIAYTLYIIYLTCFFNKHFRLSVKRLEDVYDDDMMSRLQWVRTFFYGALAVGIYALIVAIFPYPAVYNVFKIMVPVYYTYVVIHLLNYVPTSAFVVKTFSMSQSADLPAHETSEDHHIQISAVAESLGRWVANRRFAIADATVDEIVGELGVSKADFNYYFKNELNTQFRTWRRELRIREAMRLIIAPPNLSVPELMNEVGYKDRSNFYKDFQQIAGMTLKEYRELHSDASSVAMDDA